MVEERQKKVLYYKHHPDDAISPFEEWVTSIKDRNVQKAIYERFQRIQNGNYGSHRNLKGGILELKFDNGLRIYSAEIGATVVVILCNGGKNTKKDQDKDIDKARKYLKSFIARLREKKLETNYDRKNG